MSKNSPEIKSILTNKKKNYLKISHWAEDKIQPSFSSWQVPAFPVAWLPCLPTPRQPHRPSGGSDTGPLFLAAPPLFLVLCLPSRLVLLIFHVAASLPPLLRSHPEPSEPCPSCHSPLSPSLPALSLRQPASTLRRCSPVHSWPPQENVSNLLTARTPAPCRE